MKIGSYTIKFKKNPKINKKDYYTKDDKKKKDFNDKLASFKFDSKTNVVPKKTNKLVCIMLSNDKTCHFLLRKVKFRGDTEYDFFRYKKGMYIIDNEAIHITDNNMRIAVYMEGISTPLKMSNIEKTIETIEYIDLYGNKQESQIEKIKGLNFDSKILDIFANRRFAEIFTKPPSTSLQQILMILSIVSIVMLGITYFLIWFFR